MADIIRAKIEGAAELRSALEGLGTEVATKIGVTANRKAAQSFRDTLKGSAPYDSRVRERPYGHLRENIRVQRKRANKQGNIVFWITAGRAFWGAFLEFGTKRMPARPWMLPAFEQAKDRLGAIQIEELRNGIAKAAKRLARKARKG